MEEALSRRRRHALAAEIGAITPAAKSPKRGTADQRLHESVGIDYRVDWDDALPLALLPSQWRQRPTMCDCGCARLALEVLLSAVNALYHPITGSKFDRTRNEARLWFMAPDLDVIINLRDCCDALGLDVKLIQRSVLPVRHRAPAC